MIDWKCEKCGKPANYIAVNHADEINAGKARRQWDKDHTIEGFGIMCSGNDIMTYPRPAHWYISCDECDLANDNSYWITMDRIDTYEKVIHWTAHLMGKNWLSDTDWEQMLFRLCPERAP